MGVVHATKESPPARSELQQARLDAGLSIKALIEKSGVCRATIWYIEKLGHDPLYDTKRRLAKAIGKKVSEIWQEETDD